MMGAQRNSSPAPPAVHSARDRAHSRYRRIKLAMTTVPLIIGCVTTVVFAVPDIAQIINANIGTLWVADQIQAWLHAALAGMLTLGITLTMVIHHGCHKRFANRGMSSRAARAKDGDASSLIGSADDDAECNAGSDAHQHPARFTDHLHAAVMNNLYAAVFFALVAIVQFGVNSSSTYEPVRGVYAMCVLVRFAMLPFMAGAIAHQLADHAHMNNHIKTANPNTKAPKVTEQIEEFLRAVVPDGMTDKYVAQHEGKKVPAKTDMYEMLATEGSWRRRLAYWCMAIELTLALFALAAAITQLFYIVFHETLAIGYIVGGSAVLATGAVKIILMIVVASVEGSRSRDAKFVDDAMTGSLRKSYSTVSQFVTHPEMRWHLLGNMAAEFVQPLAFGALMIIGSDMATTEPAWAVFLGGLVFLTVMHALATWQQWADSLRALSGSLMASARILRAVANRAVRA